MSVADLYDLELTWPSLGPTVVIATGTFDQWSSSIRLAKGGSGFFGTVKVPWGQKVAYKFIVDGHWKCRDDRPQEDDGNGNINNVLQVPEKPVPVVARDPLARLSIPLDDPPSEGYGDVENMVTAIEFLPLAEPTVNKGSHPPPVPQITVEGLGQVHSLVNGSNLNTAAATEGNISPASVTARAETTASEQAQDAPVPPLGNNDSVQLAPTNGSGETSDVPATHAPSHTTKGESSISPSVPETAEAVHVPLESAAPQPSHVPEATQANAPPAALEPTAEQPEADPREALARGHPQQAAGPAFKVPASTSTTPASSTATNKKRRSFLARIKHIFDKDKGKDKREKNAKDKH